MNYWSILLVSVALGIDAFSVAISIGLAGVRRKEFILVAAVVTLFHILMPLAGLSLGSYLGKLAGPLASIIGALVLISIGLSTIWSSVREMKEPSTFPGRSKGMVNIANPFSLVIMAASVSLDALTVGFGLGTLRVDLLLTVLTMGAVAGIMTAGGLFFGKRLNVSIGEKAEILGGIILVLIGIKFLIW